jgi:hypothetical protein
MAEGTWLEDLLDPWSGMRSRGSRLKAGDGCLSGRTGPPDESGGNQGCRLKAGDRFPGPQGPGWVNGWTVGPENY